jgi:hypothetical protein
MVGPLGGRLPGHRLPDDRQCRQRGQASKHVPADHLRPDRALHLDVFICGLKLPRDHLHRDQQRRGHGDDPEHRQGDGLRFHCPVDLSLDDRGDVKGVRCAGRKGRYNLPFCRRDPARAITEPESVQPVPRSHADQPRKRRREQQERREAVDLVHHHLVVEHHGARGRAAAS